MATYNKGKRAKLSSNFNLKEFECKCNECNITIVDAKLVNSLQTIRDHYKKKIYINSGYRCAKHNKAVGGSASSQHTKGKAADIVVKGIAPKEVAAFAESIGIKGIGLYDTFVHIDTRTNKAYWQGQEQKPITTFITRKSNRQIAEEIIEGIWGNGAARKRKLVAAGYNYKEIQALVNELLRKQRRNNGTD